MESFELSYTLTIDDGKAAEKSDNRSRRKKTIN